LEFYFDLKTLSSSWFMVWHSLVPSAGQAQVTLDVTQVTCANYLAMSPNQAREFFAWMSGWFNQRFGYITVGFDDFARNIASISQWCSGNPQATIMAALERSTPQPAPTGQIMVDMSLITCKQYLASDAQRQDMIAYWMSGYFRASRNEPIFDFQRFAKNKTAVGNYCKKNGGETVMSAIQKNAR
jgi:HdeA/HdeB family